MNQSTDQSTDQPTVELSLEANAAAEKLLSLCGEMQKHAQVGEFMPQDIQLKRFAAIITEAYVPHKAVLGRLLDSSREMFRLLRHISRGNTTPTARTLAKWQISINEAEVQR